MGLQELDNNSTREQLSMMPFNKEFTEELSEGTKYKLNKDGTLTLKNKLVMREGEHNEVYYSWEELKAKYLTGEGAGLFYDHEDSVQNYAGLVKNLKLNEQEKAIYGDIHVTNKQSALDISLGAKWGVSPTIDAEKLLKDGVKHAVDPNFLSYSLVLRPAVRETMLNSQNDNSAIRGENKLEEKERVKFELAAKEKDTKIQKLEDEAKKLEGEKADAEKKVEEAEKKETDREAEELCELECSIGFTTEAEKNTRLEELKSLSAESRNHLKSAHEKYAKTLNLGLDKDDNGEAAAEELKEKFLGFRKEYLSANPKATNAEIQAAFSKAPEKLGEGVKAQVNADLNDANPQVRMKAELAAKEASQGKLNSNILAYMKEQEQK